MNHYFIFIIITFSLDINKVCSMDTSIFVALTSAAKFIGAGMATSGVIGAGAGIGIVFAGLLKALCRNPQLEPRLMQITILGFALTEAMGLLAIMMAFLILFS